MYPYLVLLLTVRNDLSEVYNACWEFRANWREIGLDLGIKESSLDAILVDEKECGKCMMKMFSAWLKRENEQQSRPTWKCLCTAIARVDRTASERIFSEHQSHCDLCKGKFYFSPQGENIKMKYNVLDADYLHGFTLCLSNRKGCIKIILYTFTL